MEQLIANHASFIIKLKFLRESIPYLSFILFRRDIMAKRPAFFIRPEKVVQDEKSAKENSLFYFSTFNFKNAPICCFNGERIHYIICFNFNNL